MGKRKKPVDEPEPEGSQAVPGKGARDIILRSVNRVALSWKLKVSAVEEPQNRKVIMRKVKDEAVVHESTFSRVSNASYVTELKW